MLAIDFDGLAIAPNEDLGLKFEVVPIHFLIDALDRLSPSIVGNGRQILSAHFVTLIKTTSSWMVIS